MNVLIKKIVMPEFVEMPKDYVYEVRCDGCGNVIKHCISDWYVVENILASYDDSKSNDTKNILTAPLWKTSILFACPLCHTGHSWTPELIETLRPYVDASKKYKVYSAMATTVSSILLNCTPTANGFKLKPNADANTQEVDFTIEWDDEISEVSKCMLLQKMDPFNVKDIVRHIKSIEFDREIDLNNYYTYIPYAFVDTNTRPGYWVNVNGQSSHPQPYYQVQSNCMVPPEYRCPDDSDEKDGGDDA